MVNEIKKNDSLNDGREKLNNAIKAFNETVAEGDSSVEAAQARVDEKGNSHDTLKDRLDYEHSEVTSQLADAKYQLSSNINKKVGDGKLAEMGDLSQAVKEAMTGGSVAVVGEGAVSMVNLANDVKNKVSSVDFKADNIVFENLIEDGSFENMSNAWILRSASFSSLDSLSGEISGRIHAASTSNPEIRQQVIIPEGHKIYFKSYAKILETDGKNPSVTIADYHDSWENTEEFKFDTEIINSWQSVSGVVTSVGEGITFRLLIRGSEVNAKVHFDDVILVDLTEAFGAGNEPDKNVFEDFIEGQTWGNTYQLKLQDIVIKNLYSKTPNEIATFNVTQTEKREHLPIYGATGLNISATKMARANFSVMGSIDGQNYQRLQLISKTTGNTFTYIHHPDSFYVDVAGYNYVNLEIRIPFNIGSATINVSTDYSGVKPIKNKPTRYVPNPLKPEAYRTSNPRSISVTGVAKDGTWYGVSGTVFEKSVDFGDSWTELYRLDSSDRASHIRKLDDGTLLLVSQNGNVYKSNIAQDTFTEKMSMSSPDIKISSRFGFDTYENVALLAEYGDKNGSDNPRRVYLSTDFGDTWKVIFEPEVRANYHTHDVRFDPYDDIIWVVNGDTLDNSNVHYSTDWGETWTSVYIDGECPNQFTSILPMPECVLFLTDNRHDGVYRWDRVSGGIESVGQLLLEPAYTINLENDAEEMIGNRGFVDFYGDGSAYFGYAQFHTNVKERAIVYATKNGYDFYKIWVSDYMPSQDAQGFVGISGVAGIDDNGFMGVSLSGVPVGEGMNLKLKKPNWGRV